MANIFDKPQAGGNIFSKPSTTATGGSIFSTTKPDLTTTTGAQQFATSKGLGQKVSQVKPKGEDPKKIFSGGFIQDVFDVLNAPQSVVAGIFKGQNLIDAIQTKASFSDAELLGKYGKKGVIAGIIADIATDPLMLIPVFGIGSKILEGVRGGTKFLAGTKIGSPVADFIGKRFVYRYSQSPEYIKLAEDAITTISKGSQRALELARPITELSIDEQKIIAAARKAGNIESLPENLLSKAKPAFDELDRLGKEAVNQGLLDAETYQSNLGKYLARLYRTKEAPTGKITGIFDKKPLRIDTARFMKRQDIPEDIRKAMGEILEAGYPTAKSLVQINQAVQRSKFFTEVATRWGSDAVQDGMKLLPETKRLGQLSGKYVPEPIFNDVQEIIRAKSWGEQLVGKAVTGFKYGKVILNPATHARNIISNFILNNFEGLSPARLDIYARAAREMATNGKLYQEAKAAGLGLETFYGAELKAILNNVADPAIKRIPKQLAAKLGDLYQTEEKFAKMAQYVYQRTSLGKSAEEAFRVAERATFNYAQVTPFIRRLRESAFGMPFITFTYKATPQVARTLITKPAVVGKYGLIKRDFEKLSPQDQLAKERAVEPDYIRKGFYVRLPFEDKENRALYFDMTYILPFGDIMSGSLFETEKPGEAFTQTALKKFPLLNIVGELYTNEDFFGQPIVRATSTEPLEIGRDILGYILKQYGPPVALDTPFRLKEAAGLSKLTREQKGAKRTITEEILRNFGLKVKPFVVEQEAARRERETRTRTIDILQQAGEVKEAKIPFIPK